jgi:hypothetical protein
MLGSTSRTASVNSGCVEVTTRKLAESAVPMVSTTHSAITAPSVLLKRSTSG